MTLARAGRGHGYAPLGIEPLRERVAELVTDRVTPTSPAQVAITLGVQHGIALAVEALGSPGDTAVMEDPSYAGAIDAFSRAGLSLVAVRSDTGGTQPSSLRSVVERADPRIVYLSPQCASPTGVVTTPARCSELSEVLTRSRAWLIEDAALEFLVPQCGQTFSPPCGRNARFCSER